MTLPPLLNPYLDLWEVLRAELPEEALLAARKKLIWAYSWAIPNARAIEAISNRGPLVEMGAGTGYWAWLCQQAGANVVAIDRNASAPPHWMMVQTGEPGSLISLGERNLLLCWPPLDEPMALESLRTFSGEFCFYVGEFDGRTGSTDFHSALRRDFQLQQEIEIPRWPGFQDSLFIFRRAN